MGDPIIRRGEPANFEPAVAVWLAANSARRKGSKPGAEQATRVRHRVSDPGAFLLVAEETGDVVGMALGMQGLADDGAAGEGALPRLDGLRRADLRTVAHVQDTRGVRGRGLHADGSRCGGRPRCAAGAGRSLSVVTGGITVSFVIGIPLGSIIGTYSGWRLTFVMVAALGWTGSTCVLVALAVLLLTVRDKRSDVAAEG